MIDALCNGKLSREVEGMEDLLTSAVFGRLRYLPPEEGLLPFLWCAKYLDGTSVLPEGLEVREVKYTFWPWWELPSSSSAEPDLVIELSGGNGDAILVLIEAKFRSFKSSEADLEIHAPNDQLAREWENLSYRCEQLGSV